MLYFGKIFICWKHIFLFFYHHSKISVTTKSSLFSISFSAQNKKHIDDLFFFFNQKYFWFGKLNILLLAICLFMEININVYIKEKF